VTFNHPATASIFRGIPVHPTQLYLAGGNLILFVFLLSLWNRPALRGAQVWMYLCAYGLLRFIVEFYRGDVRPMVGVLTLDQVICIGFLVVGGVMLARRFLISHSRRQRETLLDQGPFA
jgi:phosphatidylglycerol:prolipoprotein diacylglycerol transferase